jgi:hypothetical protein
MSEIKASSYWSFADGTRVSIGKVHAMDPAELFAFLDWFALESYKRGMAYWQKEEAGRRAHKEFVETHVCEDYYDCGCAMLNVTSFTGVDHVMYDV